MIPAEQVKEKILTLQTRLLESHPMMPILLKEIHTILKQDPEIVTVLSEEEIGIIVSGLKRQVGVEISTTAAKKKTNTAKLKNLTLTDL